MIIKLESVASYDPKLGLVLYKPDAKDGSEVADKSLMTSAEDPPIWPPELLFRASLSRVEEERGESCVRRSFVTH
jgi:hypothetical protein